MTTPTTELTGAALLREAARAMREDPDARWHAVAEWLDTADEQYDDENHRVIEYSGMDPECDDECPSCIRNDHAEAAARAFLGLS